MASSSSTIQTVIPALAIALARLRRTPGRNQGWLSDALLAVERTDGVRYERIRRRIGFARRLGDLAGLGVEETAIVTLALFFHELIDDQPQRSRGATRGVWLDFLLRNEVWLAPAFEACAAMGADEWQALDSKATAVAKLTTVFDRETLERHNRPFQVLQNMMGEIDSPLLEELVPLLWSEEGQQLCDHHFRRHPDGYKLETSELRNAFEVLRRLAPTSLAEEEAAAVAPIGLFGKALPNPAKESATGAAQPTSKPRPRATTDRPGTASPAGANFDRRREALRARSAVAEQQPAAGSPPEQSQEHRDLEEPPVVDTPITVTPAAETLRAEEPRPAGRYEVEPDRDYVGPARREEEPMEQTRTTSPVRPGPADVLDMMQKLRDVRLQLGEIQRIALDAEQLLTGLAPQLGGLSAWIADLDAVVDRWRSRQDIERAA